MGNVCMGEQRIFRKIDEYTHPLAPASKRASVRHSRFGNVEKISTRQANGYKLIMAANSVKLSTISIECRIMQSTAEFQLYDGTKFQLLDKSISPIIDLFNPEPTQIYHPIRNHNRSTLTLKVYPFSGYNHTALKRALHEVWVYNELRSLSPLVDAFVMTRGKSSAFVMTFKSFEVSLMEMVRYRQLADYHWTQAELVTLWKILISNYKHLRNLSICHREIRLGKIFYTSENKHQPYQFANLETARKVNRSDASDLLTVVGVDLFAESPMKEKIENEEELAMYDPFAYDVQCLIRVLLSLLNLDPLESESQQCRNTNLAPIIERLKSSQPNFTEIQKSLDDILRSLVYEKGQLFRQDKIISDHLCKSQLRLKNRDKIDSAYFDALLHLHKKEVFNRIVVEKIEENDNLNKRYDNITILHQVGEYYSRIGLEKNEYFDEEFSLLLDLAKQCREEEFHEDHNDRLKELSALKERVSKERVELDFKYSNEVIHKYMNQGKIDSANESMGELLDKVYKYENVELGTQIDILITKSQLQIKGGRFETAENTIEKVGYIVSNSHFQSQFQAKRYQGEMEYLRAFFQVTLMAKNREEVKKKRVGTAQASITSALAIFSNLPQSHTNTIRIINTYLLKADLSDIKQAYPDCKASLQSADVLMAEVEKHRSVSDSLKLRLLQRLKTVYEKSNKANEAYYKEILSRLGKINRNFEGSNAARHQRFKEERELAKQRGKKERMMNDPYAIAEEQDEDEA